MNDTPKPGVWTTEFWLTLATTIIGALAASGVIPQADADPMTSASGKIIAGVLAAVGLVSYIVSRTMVKKAPAAPKSTP